MIIDPRILETKVSVSPRIFGLETEYGLVAPSDFGGGVVKAARELLRPKIDYTKSGATFLPNGGRLYLDVGAHPEYATAECIKPLDLVAQDRAGDLMLAQLLTDFATSSGTTLKLFRNNLDGAGNSFGCHENYQIAREGNFESWKDDFVSFLVTRTCLVGAGGVITDRNGTHFVPSVRAGLMTAVESASSTQDRPILNTRDQPLADRSKYRRLHVMLSDTNLGQFPTFLKVASALLVLQFLESGGSFADLRLADPIDALHIVGNDLSLQAEVELLDGRRLRAVEIQALMVSRVLSWLGGQTASEAQNHATSVLAKCGSFKKFLATFEVPELDHDSLISQLSFAAYQWLELCVILLGEDWSAISGRIDWLLKQEFFSQYSSSAQGNWEDPKVRVLDWSFHQVGGRLWPELETRGLVASLLTKDEIGKTLAQPPSDTRAYVRGRLIGVAQELKLAVNADWDRVYFGLNNEVKLDLDDPFNCSGSLVAHTKTKIEEIARAEVEGFYGV
ncbi:hypothetical protein BK816_03975 [Boudabousia tangfeifanii]|uniref:Proteasome accessory factor PafA2 n=1 Tax=Boudabousia tangfeifanii TaxID=1912795 RepID=A0A1D9MJS6_9ACTO|nr:proteasome accessory factor PafA2 family protein [Boudabousia tangfeifanii]AOZ72557.1 hypothetical protein BK816_03975 [Boudabousia tangfeifanii]